MAKVLNQRPADGPAKILNTEVVAFATPGVANRSAVAESEPARILIFLHALAFVVGFGTVFTLLGSAAGLLGQSLNQYLPVIQKLGAILLVIFGLTTLGFFRWLVSLLARVTDLERNPAAAALASLFDFFNTLLYTEKRIAGMHQVYRGWGFVSSALLGVSFSAGWVPCIGPILAGILFLAGDSATASRGALLLAIYSLGLGIPFLVTGAAFSGAAGVLRRMNRFLYIVSIASGIFLFFLAALLWTDQLAWLTQPFLFLNDWVFRLEDNVAAVSGSGGDVMGLSVVAAAPLAFMAGLISFLSPCVLPLVPAYLGFLSSAAVGSRPMNQ